jgi:two-component system sensor histidine kinase PilS (NtrC family)
MTLRLVIVAFILGVTVLMQVRGKGDFLGLQLSALYGIVGLSFLLTGAYAVLYRRLSGNRWFSYAQLALDNLLISVIIVVTGGINSIFSVLYFLTVIGASIIFFRRGALAVTSLASLLYLTAIFVPFLQAFWPWLDPEGRYDDLARSFVFYRGLVTVASFYTVWLLASYLSESLRRADEALHARESDLAQLQSLYENIVQSIASGLITTDLEGRIVSFNRAAEKMSGWTSVRCLGMPFSSIFTLREERDPFRHPWRPGETGWRCDGTLVDQPSTILGMTFSPLRDDAGVIKGVICSFQDLTALRKMEEQIKWSDRLAAVGEMAAGVAHEIRNPLASISGSIQVLREDLPPDEGTRSLMDIVTRETERLNGIITDFLLFANPRPLSREDVDLAEILRETLRLMKKSLEHPEAYHFSVRAAERCTAFVDPQLIRQVFWNLSLNAFQAMPEGGRLDVKVRRDENGADRAWLIVEFVDSGAGISLDDMRRVFTPFFSTKEKGSGLGLSIVFKIIEQHGGTMDVESKPGAGSTFRVRLPAAAPAADGG